MDSELLSQVFVGLTITQWGSLLAIWVAAAAVLFVVKRLVVGRFSKLAERTTNNIDDMLVVLLRGTRVWFLGVVGLFVAVHFIAEDALAASIVRRVTFLSVLMQAGLWGNALIAFWSKWYIDRENEDGVAQVTAVRAVGLIARIVVWAVLLILALDNFGIDITALVAGLGIGGIAIALAVQNILQDLLAYISIVVDKPFVHGDFLVVGDHSGSVEHIGIKTTRLRSLSGEQLIFSNTDLLGSRIRNYRRMYERRIAFEVGVTYSTPRENLKQIPELLKKIIERQEDVRFDRSHMKSFGDSAITFETVYYMEKPDYGLFMDRQQSINLEIHKLFEDLGIGFAFPTQSIHIESLPEGSSV